GPERCIAARLVERGMRRRDNRCATRHRLDDRDTEALVERGIDEDLGTPIEIRQLPVGDITEAADARHREPGRRAPPVPPCQREREVARDELPRLEEAREVLARLERADAQHVRTADVRAATFGDEACTDPGRRNVDPLAWHTEKLD